MRRSIYAATRRIDPQSLPIEKTDVAAARRLPSESERKVNQGTSSSHEATLIEGEGVGQGEAVTRPEQEESPRSAEESITSTSASAATSNSNSGVGVA